MNARQAASGRRAHQMCSVEMWPVADILLVSRVRGDLLERKGDLDQALAALSQWFLPRLRVPQP